MTRDPLDDPGSLDPGVSALFDYLTSPATPGEVAGEAAARAMFAAARALDPAVTQSPPPLPPPSRDRVGAGRGVPPRGRAGVWAGRSGPRWRPAHVGGRLAAGAAVVAVAFGFAAAGYAEVLPSPLQHVAHQILGFAGVPNSPHSSTGPGTAGTSPGQPPAGNSPGGQPTTVGSESPTPAPSASSSVSPTPTPSHASSRSASPSPSRSGSPHPSPSGSQSPGSPLPGPAPQLTIAAPQTQIVAGASVQITSSVSVGGQPPARPVKLTLLELAAGRATWRNVAHGKTSRAGQLTLTVPALKRNASFRVTGPHHLTSDEVSIVVAPTVSLTATQRSRRLARLAVSSPLARRGDIVSLEVSQSGGRWRIVRTHRLHEGRRAAFHVVIRKVSLTYQVILEATPLHGQSVSNEVTIAARAARAPKTASPTP